MEEHIGMYVKKISEKLERRANEDLQPREFTFTQGKVLWYLHKNEGQDVTLKDIEKFLDCSHATVSGLVSRLEKKGLVSIEPSETDKRARNVRLTEKEMNNFRGMLEHRKQMETLLLSGFSEQEKAEVLKYFKRIYNNLQE